MIGGKLKDWLRSVAENHRIRQQLPKSARVRNGRRGHIRVEADGLSYEFDRSRFESAEQLGAYAASKLPR